jgi:transcriptional regulator with XRE-family HTH domain
MKKKTNFDIFLEEQLRDPEFKRRFEQAGEAWEVAIQLAALRKARGFSQKQLADKIGTSQQQISRLESPSYQGHSLSMLRRVVEALGGTLKVEILLKPHKVKPMVAEGRREYHRE